MNKKPLSFGSLIASVAMIFLFGPLPGLLGIFLASYLHKKFDENDPEAKSNVVKAYAIGAIAAFAIQMLLLFLAGSLAG